MFNNVLVTGGCGFIASNFLNIMKQRYPDINFINIDKLDYCSNVENVKPGVATFVKGNVGNEELIEHLIKKYSFDAIFNFAAQSHVDNSFESALSFTRDNTYATHVLIECCRRHIPDVEIIHFSTDEVYGDILDKKVRANETFQYNPSSPYAASKASSDHLVKSYVRTFKLPAIITNCSNNYGPNQNPEKLIPKIIFNILNNLPIPVYGKGNNSREWLHVKDHCRALEILSTKGKIGENYNIGSGNNLSNLNLIKTFIRLMKKNYKLNAKFIFIKDRPGHDLRYALNSKKIRTKLNWKPKINLLKGISETIDWYMQNQNYFKNLKGTSHLYRLGLKI